MAKTVKFQSMAYVLKKQINFQDFNCVHACLHVLQDVNFSGCNFLCGLSCQLFKSALMCTTRCQIFKCKVACSVCARCGMQTCLLRYTPPMLFAQNLLPFSVSSLKYSRIISILLTKGQVCYKYGSKHKVTKDF